MSSSQPLSNEPRIEIIDGFRCIAVMCVVVYHYFYRFHEFPSLPDYPSWRAVSNGFFGVHFFFLISGFVIYRSMEQSFGIKQFIGKRYLRLAPALLLCSIITLVVIAWLNDSSRTQFISRTPRDLLFSFTFIHPDAWSALLGKVTRFMDGAYWSLWPEIIFYLSASLVYFNSRKENFLRNWVVLVMILYLLRIATSPRLAGITPDLLLPVSSAYQTYLLANISYFSYFTAGIVFYSLWTKRSHSRFIWITIAALFLLEMYFSQRTEVRYLFPLVATLWIIFLKRPQWLSFLLWRPIQVVGMISYPLYLLHQMAGLVLTEKLLMLTNHSVPVELLLTIVMGVFILLSYWVFVYVEKPVTKALKERLLGIK